MYLQRKADVFLKDWKSQKERKPLIIKGARQVGKTKTIREFAAANYKSVIEINFITHPAYKGIFENGYGVNEIINLISRINPSFRFIEHQTLIFFDEIQDYPDAATSLKFFNEDKRFDVICSGSLLGIQYKQISSISVGNKTDYQMFSMDFEEFLWAKGYKHNDIEDLLNHMLELQPLSPLEHHIFDELFLDYSILGGMPEIISQYISNGTHEGLLALQHQMLADYESDIRKYSEGLDQTRIVSVFRSIPAQLAKENKKFQYSMVARGARSKDYIGCIEWLEDAGLINICHCLHFPELPLKGNEDVAQFKIYMADTGLLMASLDDEAQADVRANRNLGVYKGALYENFAAEALTKQGYALYYYKKENSTLEEDFFIRSANELIPIEVKASTNKAKSLKQLLSSDHYPDIQHGIKFTAGNIGMSDHIITFPYFCLFLLKRYIIGQNIML